MILSEEISDAVGNSYGKSKRENQIKINYFLSSLTDYHSIFFYILNQYAQVGGGDGEWEGVGRGEVRSYGDWATVGRFFCYCTLNS